MERQGRFDRYSENKSLSTWAKKSLVNTHIIAKQNLRTGGAMILVAADHSTFAWTTWHDKARVQIDQVRGTVLDVGCAGKTPRRLAANGDAKRRLDLNTDYLSN